MRSGSIFRSLTLAVLMLGLAAGSADAQFTGKYKRMKLLEQFTSATCPPCATAAPYIKSVVKLENDIISIRYHMNYPAPGDPWNVMNGNDPSIRHNLYGINGIPYLRVGGTMNINPTAGIPAINNLISQIPPTSMAKIDVKQKGGNVEVTVTTDRALTNAKLFFATIQQSVTIANLPSTLPNSNGESEFGDIMMFMYPDANGTPISQAANETKVYTFTPGMGKGQEWNPNNLYGIAFIQDNATLEVIQAGASVTDETPVAFDYFESSRVTVTIAGTYDRVDRNGTREKNITLSNAGSTPNTVDLRVTNNDDLTQAGITAVIEPASVTVPAGGTASAKLKVTGPDRSIFFSVSTAGGATDGLGSIIPPVYFLVNGAKIVNYYGLGNEGAPLTQIAALNSNQYNKDVVYMPFATEILTNYPTNEFGGVILALDGAWLNLRGNVLSMVEDALRARKGVWIQTQSGMRAAYQDYATNAAFNATRTFYSSVLGIQFTTWTQRVQVSNNQITGLITYPVRGVGNDPIGNGISFTGNQWDQNTWPYYIIGTDIMARTATSKAVPVLYYDNDQSKLAMVRVEPTYGGRLVYGSVGVEAIAAEGTRNTLTEKVITWLLNETTPTPKIAVSQSTLNFGTININSNKDMTVVVSNTGNAELSITGANLTGVDSPSFAVVGGAPSTSSPIRIAAGQTHTMTVRFAPSAVKNNYAAVLGFASNSTESATVQLRGAAIDPTSVETDVVSETGAIRLTLNGANPVTSASSVKVVANGTVEVSVVDANGRTVATLLNGAVNGAQTVALNADNFASGMYTLVATNGADRAVLTVVVAR